MIHMITVEIPNGVEVQVTDNIITVKGPLGTNARKVNDRLLTAAKGENGVQIDYIKGGSLEKKAANAEKAFASELRNDMRGVTEYFEVNMKAVFAHFPISLEAKENCVNINNMIGERVPRVAKLAGSTKAEAKGQNLRLYGVNVEDVTQSAANVRKACRIRFKDCRIFQDGLYYNTE